MKRISYFFFLFFLTSLVVSSCSNTKTYADQLDDEKVLIANYIKRNNIDVLSEFPIDSVFAANQYVLTSSGLYFQLVNKGDVKSSSLMSKDKVTPRFIQYTLDEAPDTLRNWTSIDLANPGGFIYQENQSQCAGFQEAVKYMKHNDSEAKLIVPSTIGFNKFYYGLLGNSSDGTFDYMSTVTPLGYILKIRIL